MRIWTVGHGTRTLDELIDVLCAAGIAAVTDIRAFPGSRRHPQFASAALRAGLADAGIRYEHIGELGGRRSGAAGSPHRALRVAAFRAYADHMASDEFRGGYVRLARLARERPSAFMCAETLWWRCHRRLVSDRLLVDGWEVTHLLAPGKAEPHRLWDAARVEDGRLVYDAGTLPLDP